MDDFERLVAYRTQGFRQEGIIDSHETYDLL